jgi:hypothetical protein
MQATEIKRHINSVFLFASIRMMIKYCSKIINSRKNLLRTLYEVYRYQRYYRNPFGVRDYFYYGLDKKDVAIAQIFEYIPNNAHYRMIGLTRYKEYDCLAYDKRFEYLMLRTMNLPHPEVLLLMFNGIITDSNFGMLDIAEANAILINCGSKRFFLKPSFSNSTKGTDVISISENILYRMNGEITTLTDLCKEAIESPAGYVLQREMEDQHPIMRSLNPDSVNTLRIATYRSGEVFKIIGTFIRVGRKGIPFDNIAAGGVFILVDNETFTTVGECFIHEPGIRSVGDKHPDTGVVLVGVKIPFSTEIITMLDYATTVFSEQTYLGWDIALTTKGPCIIEVQCGFDIAGHQTATQRGLRDDYYYDPKGRSNQRSRWADEHVYWKNLENKEQALQHRYQNK